MPLEVNWPFPNFKRSHRLWNICSAVVIPIVGATSKIWLSWLNKVRVHNFKSLIHEIENRPEGQPLVTICNHHSCYDDPGLWGLLHWRILFRSNIIRWSGAASDVIFLNNFLAKFFAMGQTVPIVRGDGVYERSIEFLIQRLNEGKWVHFFPEGRVNLEKKKFLRLKWGLYHI
ncbi:Tafazzin [Nymphon striatum]|nr:Tafazzin [Nymphon striatum]